MQRHLGHDVHVHAGVVSYRLGWLTVWASLRLASFGGLGNGVGPFLLTVVTVVTVRIILLLTSTELS